MLMRAGTPTTATDRELRTAGWPVAVRFVLYLVVLALLYLAVCWYAGRSIPPDTKIAGISVGGLTEDQAAQRLDEQLDQVMLTPVKVTWPGGMKRVEPASLGLSVDARASVAGLTEFTVDPRRVWDRLTSGTEHQGVVVVDAAAADRTLHEWAGQIDRPVTQALISFDGGTVQATAPQEGRRLDVPATRQAIAATWPSGTPGTSGSDVVAGTSGSDVASGTSGTDVAAVLTGTAPAVSPERFEAAKTVASTAVSGPLTVRSGQATGSLTPQALAPALSMATEGGDLVLRVDESRFVEAARVAVPGFDTDPVQARLVVPSEPGAVPVVEPGTPGWTVISGEVADVVRTALTTPERTAVLPVTEQRPSLTPEQISSWGITTAVAQADLPAPVDPTRTAVLTDLVAPLDGVLLAPGSSLRWNITPAGGTGQGDGDPAAAIGVVTAAASSAGLAVAQDTAAGVVTITNPRTNGVFLQVNGSGRPTRFVVWGNPSDR